MTEQFMGERRIIKEYRRSGITFFRIFTIQNWKDYYLDHDNKNAEFQNWLRNDPDNVDLYSIRMETWNDTKNYYHRHESLDYLDIAKSSVCQVQ